MDSVELVMEVEKAFNISIPDRECEKVYTEGDFHHVVWKHVEGRRVGNCKSQSLFYKLRNGFQREFNISRNEVTTDSNVSDIFPEQNRRQIYYAFAERHVLHLPDLELTRPWYLFLNSFGIITIIGGLALSFVLVNFFDYSRWLFLLPLAGIIYTVLISDALDHKRIVIANTQMRGFIKCVLAKNLSALAHGAGMNRKEMEQVINILISEKSGVSLEEITPGKKFGDDLGMD